MPSCPRCGAAQAERSAFCSACGALIDRPNTAAPDATSAPSTPAAAPTAPTVGSPLPEASAPGIGRLSTPVARHDFGDIGVYIVRRFLALVVDLAGVGFLIGIGLVASVDAVRANPDQFLAAHLQQFAIALAGAVLLYLTIAEALFGSTIGKGFFGLGVGRKDGRRLGLGRALVRNIVLPLDLALIGFLLATVTPSRARIGDLVAGSVVTNARIGRLATVTAAFVGAGAAWLLFANADGARMSSQLLAVAGLRMPVDSGPLPSPTAKPSPSVPPRPLPAASDESTPSPAASVRPTPRSSPSADPGRPIPI
jgi:uncharacterized RDD family membrane protein YckC